MIRPLTRVRSFALAVLAFLPTGAFAQEDTNSAAAAQKLLASGTDLQKRLRVDSFAVADGKVNVTGAFLDAPAKEGDPPAFELVQNEAGKLLRESLKSDKLQFDFSGVKKIEPKDHPHVVLQRAANAAGAKGDTAADRCAFLASSFGPDGSLVLSGKRGKDEAVAKWLATATAEHLANHPAVKVVSEKPLVTDEVKPVEWKLAPSDVQKLLAASPDAPTRRLRVDRAYLSYDADTPNAPSRPSALRFTLVGMRLGEDAVDTEAIPDACRKQWPDLFAGSPKVLIDLKPLLGPGVPEQAAKLQAAVAKNPALDGVRIDAGAEFAPDGSLMLAGVQPGLSPAAGKELTATYQAVLKELIDKGDATSGRYKRLAESPLSTKRMALVPTGKVLAELREWAADTLDDVRVSRVHFGADGALKLDAVTVTKADAEKVLSKFKELSAKHLPAGTLTADAARTEPATFGAGLTAHLRNEMAGDQKRWTGVLIERGYFDDQNRFTLRGVVDKAAQNDELAKVLDALRADPKWAGFCAVAPNKPALDVVPLSDLLERVKRVAPAYPEFDGIRIESAEYDKDVNLVFNATTAVKLDSAASALLARLLRDHPTYKRRLPADKQVKIVSVGGPGAEVPDGQFSVAYGVKLFEGTDPKKARAWLDSALLHHSKESGAWFLSAYSHHLKGDTELVRRDLFRMIALESPQAINGAAQRKRRYEDAKNLQGKERNELEALCLEYARELKDGAKPLTLVKEK